MGATMGETAKGDIVAFISKYVNPKYVKSIAQNGDIYYTDDFYEATYENTERGGMTAVESYNSLGFNTQVLTEARAYAARTRAIRRMDKKRAFEKNIAAYDSDTTFEQMISKYVKGEISRDDLYANMAARLIVLEEIHKGLKKTISSFPGEKKK